MFKLYWRENDLNIFSIIVLICFSSSIIMLFYFKGDWWLLPFGIGEVAMILFIICNPTMEEEEE